MKQILFVACCLLAVVAPVNAQSVSINRLEFGSGEPGPPGRENAQVVENNIYHAPQYLPGHPTAATIWARVVFVNCRRADQSVECDGYHWAPGMGRGEYLYFSPVFAAAPEPR